MKRWLLGISMAFNQLFSALLGGDPDISVSARAGYARAGGSGTGTVVCQILDWLDPHDGDALKGDHCDIAIINDKNRDEERNKRRRLP